MKKGKMMLTSTGISDRLSRVSITKRKIVDLTKGKTMNITKKRGK